MAIYLFSLLQSENVRAFNNARPTKSHNKVKKKGVLFGSYLEAVETGS